MAEEIRAAIIGMDTSHAIEFSRRLQAPDCPADQKVAGMRAVSCLRFETPFQDKEGLDKRTAQLEEWGIPVTESFDKAVADCDVLLLEINDPACHVQYFERCAELGKPLFLDKPLADTMENGRKIAALAKDKGTRMFSSSSLRFVPALDEACAALAQPTLCHTYGPLGKAAAGSSIVWYGVHACEMLERALGCGARKVTTQADNRGVVICIEYDNDRRGVVELTEGAYVYGGDLRTAKESAPFVVKTASPYVFLLRQIVRFFQGGEAPLDMADTLEVMAILDAAERSLQEKQPVSITDANG